ncbi:MAG TPA: hypothetical protein VNM45_13660 [Bacillus sp. (in: firmicutes)]|nr:hypothetical protein [Bacillus sp. (in: firmicutes)]
MSDEMGLFLTIVLGIVVFGLINFFVFKYSQRNMKKEYGLGLFFSSNTINFPWYFIFCSNL